MSDSQEDDDTIELIDSLLAGQIPEELSYGSPDFRRIKSVLPHIVEFLAADDSNTRKKALRLFVVFHQRSEDTVGVCNILTMGLGDDQRLTQAVLVSLTHVLSSLTRVPPDFDPKNIIARVQQYTEIQSGVGRAAERLIRLLTTELPADTVHSGSRLPSRATSARLLSQRSARPESQPRHVVQPPQLAAPTQDYPVTAPQTIQQTPPIQREVPAPPTTLRGEQPVRAESPPPQQAPSRAQPEEPPQPLSPQPQTQQQRRPSLPGSLPPVSVISTHEQAPPLLPAAQSEGSAEGPERVYIAEAAATMHLQTVPSLDPTAPLKPYASLPLSPYKPPPSRSKYADVTEMRQATPLRPVSGLTIPEDGENDGGASSSVRAVSLFDGQRPPSSSRQLSASLGGFIQRSVPAQAAAAVRNSASGRPRVAGSADHATPSKEARLDSRGRLATPNSAPQVHLVPLFRPAADLEDAITELSKPTEVWEKQYKALTTVRSVIMYHPNVIRPQINSLIPYLAQVISSPRSMLSRAAIETTTDLFGLSLTSHQIHLLLAPMNKVLAAGAGFQCTVAKQAFAKAGESSPKAAMAVFMKLIEHPSANVCDAAGGGILAAARAGATENVEEAANKLAQSRYEAARSQGKEILRFLGKL